MKAINRKRPADGDQCDTPKRLQTAIVPLIGDANGRARLELLKSGKWSDFKIRCQGFTFNAHRVVLSGQSPFIDKVIEGGLDETPKEQLELLHEEMETVARILWFAYTGSVPLSGVVCSVLLGQSRADYSILSQVISLMETHRLANFLLMLSLEAKIFDRLAAIWSNRFLRSPKPPPTEGESDLVLRSIIAHVLGEVPPMDQVVEQMIWALVSMNEARPEVGKILLDSTLESITEEYPELGWRLYMSKSSAEEFKRPCFYCRKRPTYSEDIQRIYVSYDGTLRIIACRCGFRGLCSSMCLSDDREMVNQASWCDSCEVSEICSRRRVTSRNDLIFLNGRISLE